MAKQAPKVSGPSTSLKSGSRLSTAFETYTLGSLLGQGGVGSVWSAHDADGGEWAVKVLRGGLPTAKRKRFKNEIILCQELRHDNIVRVVDHGAVDEDGRFYVMQRLTSSLRELMPKVADRDKRLGYIAQLLAGVDAAHLRGVCHRDLKPENVLFDAKSDRLVVADFGAADFGEDALFTAVETKDGERLANFIYAAPEQRVRGGVVDARADIYALGLIIHEWFTGVVPQGTGFALIKNADPSAGWLDSIIEKMIRHAPAERPATIDQVRRQINLNRAEFLDGQKIDSLTRQVVPAKQPIDPLLEVPLAVVDANWENNVLTIELNHEVNERLRDIFRGGFSHEAVLGFGPERWQLRGKSASVSSISDRDAVQAVPLFKRWLPTVSQLYQQQIIREQNIAAAKRAAEIEKEKQEIEARNRFRAQLKL